MRRDVAVVALLALRLAIESQPIDLCGQHEIAFCKSINLVRPDRYLCLTPAKANIRMMALLFRELAYSVHEIQRLPKVLKTMFFPKVVFVNDVPARQLFLKPPDFLALQWWNTAATRHAFAFSKFTHTHSQR